MVLPNFDRELPHRMLVGVVLVLAAVHLLLQRRRNRPVQDEQPQPPAPQPPARRRRRRPTTWARQWLIRRTLYGQYEQLIQELHREDARGYKNFIRITPEFFGEMVERITPAVEKHDTNMRPALPVGLKLAVTLRYIATGNSYHSLQYAFRVSVPAISKFVPEVLQALIQAYQDEFLKCPRTPEEWKVVADGFAHRWNYHNCIGALDGKHVALTKPRNAGSLFFNYKKFHSIILMALCDANYKFLYVDVGAEGGAGDAGTWNRSTLHQALDEGRVGLPDDANLPHDDTPIPYHIVADDAFAIQPWLMKPYSHRSQDPKERIYSYRLSRARRVVENAFGVMQSKFRVFGVTQQLSPARVRLVTMWCCILHNIIVQRGEIRLHELDHEDEDHEIIPGSWRENQNLMADLTHGRGMNHNRRAKGIRDYLSHYYSSDVGSVPWQERLVFPRGRH